MTPKNMERQRAKLEWDERYSVGIQVIDNQHKTMFLTINKLIDVVGNDPDKEELKEIIQSLLEYKKLHFTTEERYFEKAHYAGAPEHIEAHKKFGERLAEIQEKCGEDVIMLTFELVDFLEDWLIDHLMNMDQKYKEPLRVAGLK